MQIPSDKIETLTVPTMPPKPIWKSKTLWTNVVALGTSFLAGYGIDLDVEMQTELAVALMALANIGLRFITKKPVTLTSAK